jgi:hypothetical protein
MNAEYKDFIAIYRDVYPEGYCQHLINEFDRLVESGAGYSRKQSENGNGKHGHVKKDMQLSLNFGVHTVAPFNGESPTRIFFDGLQKCYDDYADNFSVLKDAQIRGTAMKMQRTDPGGGYHVWHGEQGNGEHADRVLVYMLYLNTLTKEEAGETEFLYQQRRLQPTENMMVLWPATFTHAHRGNTVFGERSKYIVTGWFYYD